jgi:hypothetical protein
MPEIFKIYMQFWIYVHDSPNIHLSNTLANKLGKKELNVASVSNVFCLKFYMSPNGDGEKMECAQPKGFRKSKDSLH